MNQDEEQVSADPRAVATARRIKAALVIGKRVFFLRESVVPQNNS